MVREDMWLRDVYGALLVEAGEKDDRIVTVEADLMRAGGTGVFAQRFPGRVVNVGVAEAHMIGVAAGMAAMGKIPFTHTFTAFATRRVCDQVTLSVAYAGLNVKMMGSDPGVTAELNGGTHMSMEDVALMCNIPGMTVYEPVDSAQLKAIFPQIVAHDGPVYIRLHRRACVKIFNERDSFTLGKGTLVREGRDITLFATGIMVAEAVKAAEALAGRGIYAEIVNIHTIKPLDAEMVLKSIGKTGCAVVAENASVIGGLGSAVATLLATNRPAPVRLVGVEDHFGEVGLTDYLMQKYGLTAEHIVAEAEKALAMKNERSSA